MTGNDDLERKDDHLTKCAALCLVEVGIEVDVLEGQVFMDLEPGSGAPGNCQSMTPYQALILAEALVETAKRLLGKAA